MKFEILSYDYLQEQVMELIVSSSSDTSFVVVEKKDKISIIDAIPGCDVFIDNKSYGIRVDKEIIDAGNNLKLIVSPSIGFDNIDVEYATHSGIYVANSAGASTVAVAEATILLMLGSQRNAQKIGETFKQLRSEYPFFEFDNPETKGVELKGRTLGLIGCGAIGREVAKIAVFGFGMNVIGYDPYVPTFPDFINKRDSIECILTESDFVSLHLPSTEDTRGLIGIEQFLQMKRSAYLINSSRGDIVKENDLIEALKSGLIMGAGLDVYEHEPISETSYPLFDLERVFMMPHTAAFTIEASTRYDTYLAQNIVDVLEGRPPRRSVNMPKTPRLVEK